MTKEQKFSDALAVQVERRIFLVRGQNVMLDTDLAELYRVPSKSLNLAVKRQRRPVPGGLYVSAYRRRGRWFEVSF